MTPVKESTERVSPLQVEKQYRHQLSTAKLMQIRKLQVEQKMSFGEAAAYFGYDSDRGVSESTQASPRPGSRMVLAGTKVVPSDHLILAHAPYSHHSEQIRVLRTELLLRPQITGKANSVVLLSPCRGEGRSLMAAELAISFAQLGRPTLLVDADLRHPQQHVLFGADNRYGLSGALTENSRPWVYGIEALPCLSLLTSGPVPPNPLELLSGSHFESLFEDWQQECEFIVFDTPPIHEYSDGLAVAMIVGRVLALSRARHTPYNKMQRMLRRLAATQSQVLGAVVNHF